MKKNLPTFLYPNKSFNQALKALKKPYYTDKQILDNISELHNIFKRAIKVKNFYKKKNILNKESEIDKEIQQAFKHAIKSGDILEKLILEVEKQHGYNSYK